LESSLRKYLLRGTGAVVTAMEYKTERRWATNLEIQQRK